MMLQLRLNTILLFILLSIIPSAQGQRGPIIERSSTTRFAVIGDYGNNSSAQAEVTALIRRLNPDFIITTGDNNYPIGAQSTIDRNIGQYYSSYIAPYSGQYGSGSAENRFFPSPGNHDWETGTLKPYIDYFTLPGNERYYEFNWGNVRLFALDSDPHEPDGIDSDSVQAIWFRERLAATPEPWRIAYFHHPPYSSTAGYGAESARWSYAEWGTSAVISGHAHTYERLMIDGIPYFINGLGGGEVDAFADETLPESQFQFNAAHGAMLVEVTDTNMTFTYHGIYGRPISSTNGVPENGEWIELDASSVVQNNGLYTFILDGTYTNDVDFSSIESGENLPQLVLNLSNSDTPMRFTVQQDATINLGSPNRNAGQESNLRVTRTQSEHQRIYLQFDVTDINPDTIESATLRLHSTFEDIAFGGMALYLADNFYSGASAIWTQDEITWNNAPQIQVDVTPIDSFTVQR